VTVDGKLIGKRPDGRTHLPFNADELAHIVSLMDDPDTLALITDPASRGSLSSNRDGTPRIYQFTPESVDGVLAGGRTSIRS